MGKNKRQKLSNPHHHKGLPKPQQSQPQKAPKPANPKSISQKSNVDIEKPSKPLQHSKPTIPFSSKDKILLIGEGDLSFTASIIKHHRCRDLVPTVLEASRGELVEKYPHVGEALGVIEGVGCLPELRSAEDGEKEEEEGEEERKSDGIKIGYGVDVMKLGQKGAGVAKLREMGLLVKAKGEWTCVVDRVIFNFPHVGGKSTDVNRQVRYNQEMLVQFFRTTKPLLSPTPGSSILVTLFEGQPYTLWNIRDLARHSGLQLQRSFKFQAEAYPGYRHARTLGVVKKRGDVRGRKRSEGVSEGAWKGEERPARTYVFVRKGEESVGMEEAAGKKKRKRGKGSGSGSDDESESEVESEDEEEDYGGDGDDADIENIDETKDAVEEKAKGDDSSDDDETNDEEDDEQEIVDKIEIQS